MKELRIVHGKGYGILRKLIREQLQSNKMVAHYADEQIELGGDGVTIVNLKM
jgi:DNA mismatch repair protein MutS2